MKRLSIATLTPLICVATLAILLLSLATPSVKQDVYPPQFFALAIYLPQKVAYVASAIYSPYTYSAYILTPTPLSIAIGLDYSDYSPTVTSATLEGFAPDPGMASGVYSAIINPNPVIGYSGGYEYLDGYSYLTTYPSTCTLITYSSAKGVTELYSAEMSYGSQTYGLTCYGYAIHQLLANGKKTNMFVALNDTLSDILSEPDQYNGTSYDVYVLDHTSGLVPTPASIVAVGGLDIESFLAAVNSSDGVKLYLCSYSFGCLEIESNDLYKHVGTPILIEYLRNSQRYDMYLVIGSKGVAIINATGRKSYVFPYPPDTSLSPTIYETSMYIAPTPIWLGVPLRDGSMLVIEVSSDRVRAWRVEIGIGGSPANVTGMYVDDSGVTLSFVWGGYVVGFARVPLTMNVEFEGSINVGIYVVEPLVYGFTLGNSDLEVYLASVFARSGKLIITYSSRESLPRSISVTRVAMSISRIDLGSGTVYATVSAPNIPQLGSASVAIRASASWSPVAHIATVAVRIDSFSTTLTTELAPSIGFSTTTVLGIGVHTISVGIGVDRYGVWHTAAVSKVIRVLSTTVSTTGTSTTGVTYPSPSTSPSSSPSSTPPKKVGSEEAIVVLALILFLLLLLYRRGAIAVLSRY